jgi:hypothetical protein
MKRFAVFLILLALFPLTQCSDDNPVDTGQDPIIDPTAADSIASAGFGDLGDSLSALGDRPADELKNADFGAMRDLFEEALTHEGNNPIAHLGLAIVEILELNYNEDVWAIIDSMDSWIGSDSTVPPEPGPSEQNRHRTLLGRQFSMLVEIPFSFNVSMATAFPTNVSLSKIQQIVATDVMPALGRSLGHLATVESDVNTEVRILVDDNGVEEFIKIDLGEIYLFDASVRALRAAFGMVIAYDADLFGPDGTYNWLDEVRDLDDDGEYMWCGVPEIVVGDPYDDLNLYWDHGGNEAKIDSIVIRVLHHNYANRTSFLRLRDGAGSMQAARQDLLGTLDKLDASVHFIRNIRQNENEENVIKLTDLTDLDSDINPLDPDVPNFAKNFDKVEDVVDFVRSLLSGTVEFTEELGPNRVSFTWQMNLGGWLNSPVTDLKSLLPYHRFMLPSGAWINVSQVMNSNYDNMGATWENYVLNNDVCEWVVLSNIGIVSYYDINRDIDIDSFIELLDGPNGNVIDPQTMRFPYLPDYTLNDLFPDMSSRDRWLSLVDILDPQI